MSNQKSTSERVRQVIAEATGNEFEDVIPAAHLAADLEITALDFSRVVLRLNKAFKIDLNPQALLDETETVGQLITVVAEEIELG